MTCPSTLPAKADLEKLKRQADFIADVGTGDAGDFVTNPDTGEVVPSVPYAASQIGGIIAFDFATGGTITLRREFVQDASGNVWQWTGTLPHVVAPGTDPTLDPTWVQVFYEEINAGSVRSGAIIFNNVADMVAGISQSTELVSLLPDRNAITLGYESPNDGGGNSFVIVSGQLLTEDLGSVFDVTGGNQAVAIESDSVDLRSFGVSTATPDNQLQIQRCLEYANGKPVTGGEEEVYNYTSNILVQSKNINLKGSYTLLGVDAYATFQGSLTDLGQLTASDAFGGNQITIADASSIAADDLIIVQNKNASSFSQHRPEYYDGEFNIVESVAGNVITFCQALKGFYTSLTNINAFKVIPIRVEIEGVTFRSTGTNLFVSRIRYGRGVILEAARFKSIASTVCTSAVALEKCYDVTLDGGEYFNDAPAAGTQYGVNIVNCQLVTGKNVTTYGARHGITTGGDAEDGAAPCRYVRFYNCSISNAGGIYSADFHGNTADSGYYECTIDCDIGLAGENVDCINNTIVSKRNNPPIELQEIVGGVISIRGNKVLQGVGSAFDSICAFSSSTLSQKVDRDFYIEFNDNNSKSSAALGQLVTILYNQDSAAESTLEMNNNSISGDTSGLTAIARLAVSGLGVRPVKVEISGVYNHLSSLVEYVDLSGLFTGCYMELPSQRMPDTPLTIEVDGHESTKGGTGDSGLFTWDFINYPSTPHLSIDHNGWARAGDPQFFGAIESLTSDSAVLFLTTASSSITTPVQRTITINGSVSFDGVQL